MASHRIPFETLSAERSRLLAENDRLRQQLRDRHRDADLAGTSQAIRRVRELVDQVAPSEHSVFVCGEPGVGKTRTARAIHHTSTSPLLGLSEALDAYEKELLEDALRRAHGVRSQAARLLMTSERVLSARLRKHDIDSRRFKPA